MKYKIISNNKYYLERAGALGILAKPFGVM